MNAGKYSDRVTWLKQSFVQDTTYGQAKEAFEDNGDLWCSIEPLSAREQVYYGLMASTVEVKILVRNTPTISFKDRLMGDQGIYIIDGIKTWENELEIVAHALRE